MCKTYELVPIPDWYDGFEEGHPEFGIDEQGRKCFSIDAEIAPALRAVWAAGFKTWGCCCGHGSGQGVITIRTQEYETPTAELEPACTHEGAPRVTVCQWCWTETKPELELEIPEITEWPRWDGIRLDGPIC